MALGDKLTDRLDNRHKMNDCGEQTREIKRLKEERRKVEDETGRQ